MSATLLHVDASVRGARSLSRRLSAAIVEAWSARVPGGRVIRRDLAEAPPPFVDEVWIAAAFTAPAARDAGMRAALAPSEAIIAELEAADAIVVGTPMYNYGVPARLKAWIDQAVRVDRTFTFDLARGDFPLAPVLSGRVLALATACGEFGFGRGGVREAMNHAEAHLRVVAPYLGVAEVLHLGIEYQEFGDARHARSVEAAHAAVPELAARLARAVPG